MLARYFFRLLACFIIYGECSSASSFNSPAGRRAFEQAIFKARPRQRALLPSSPGRALNAEPFYQRWPDARNIPIELDAAYSKSVQIQPSALIATAECLK